MNFSDFFPVELWKNVLLKPKETFAKEKKNASVAGLLKHFFALAIACAIIYCGYFFFFPDELGNKKELLFHALVFALWVIQYFAIGTIVANALLWFGAKMAGGKASFIQQYYLALAFTAPMLLARIVFGTSVFALAIIVMFAIYSVYLQYLVFKEVHEISDNSAKILTLALGIPIAVIGAVASSFIQIFLFGSITA